MSASYFIGIMSGTSLDGIDVVIVDFNQHPAQLIASSTTPYSPEIKNQIETLVNSDSCSLSIFCQLDRKIAKAYATSVLDLLNQHNINTAEINAIGCHGQTIKHDPNHEHAYTLQIGDPNTLAALTNIKTVADFRRKDIALGGQGAPFAPAFHQFAFQHELKNRAIINIGGIANITLLPAYSLKQDVIGFDTGPGNTLMDHYCSKHLNEPFDKNGAFAATGQANQELIQFILNKEPYFSLSSPKSTGTDFFNLKWYEDYLKQQMITQSHSDALATLTELTACSITLEIKKLKLYIDEIYYCGGGQLNKTLMKNLSKLTSLESSSTEKLNIHPDWVEATAFAWFAKNTLENKTSNLPSVTSASKNAILGGIFNP